MRGDADVDHYQVLGVPRDASAPAIRRAYRRLARRHHPDANPRPEGAGRFAQLAQSYEILIDPARRDDYDHTLAHHEAAGQSRRRRPATTAWGDARASGRHGILELSADEAEHVAHRPLALRDHRGRVIVLPAGIRDGDQLTLVHAGRSVVLTVRVRPRG
jgi:curved DNA-binding protein CbpA